MQCPQSQKTVGTFRPLERGILGKPDREVPEAVGVSRETIWHWHHEHSVFMVELNRRRQALWAEAHERLRALVHTAVDVIEEAIKGGDRKAAVEVLKIVKLHGVVRPPERPTDPEAVLQHCAEAQARRELGDDSPLQMALRGLDGGHHDRFKARAAELALPQKSNVIRSSDLLVTADRRFAS
jgi:hypothetical protein